MARRRRRFGTRTRTIYRNVRSRVRRPRRNQLKSVAKKMALGSAIGLAVSIPLTLAGQRFNSPELVELGQRGGAIASSAMGGTSGQIGYQIGDALFDRFVVYNGQGVSGSREVYL